MLLLSLLTELFDKFTPSCVITQLKLDKFLDPIINLSLIL